MIWIDILRPARPSLVAVASATPAGSVPVPEYAVAILNGLRASSPAVALSLL